MKTFYKDTFNLNTSKKFVSYLEWADDKNVYVKNGFYVGSFISDDTDVHVVIPEYVTNLVVKHVPQVFASLKAAYEYIEKEYPEAKILEKKIIHI